MPTLLIRGLRVLQVWTAALLVADLALNLTGKQGAELGGMQSQEEGRSTGEQDCSCWAT